MTDFQKLIEELKLNIGPRCKDMATHYHGCPCVNQRIVDALKAQQAEIVELKKQLSPVPSEPMTIERASELIRTRMMKESDFAELALFLAKTMDENDKLSSEHSTCATRLKALEESHGKLFEALNKIASWQEGPEVTGKFDEPVSARMAREALAQAEALKLTEAIERTNEKYGDAYKKLAEGEGKV